MGDKSISKCLDKLTRLLSIVGRFASRDALEVFVKGVQAASESLVLLDVFIHVEFRLEEGEDDIFFTMVVVVEEMRPR